MSPPHRRMPRIGKIGTKGHLKGRGRSGATLRRTRTPPRHEDEREERPDVREIRRPADVREEGGDADGRARHDRRDVGRSVDGVHLREPARQEPVARHRHEDARLAELEDEEHARHSRQRARRDDSLDPGLVRDLHGGGDGRRVVDEAGVARHPGEHRRDGDVEHRADGERAQDADRHVALRVLALFGGRRDGVEADEGEEDDGRAAHDAGDAVRREGVPVGPG